MFSDIRNMYYVRSRKNDVELDIQWRSKMQNVHIIYQCIYAYLWK